MSDVAVSWAKAQDCPTRPSKPLLAFLASYANAAGEGWAGVEVLALELQCDARSIHRGLKELRAAGLLLDTGKWETYRGKRYPIFRLPLEKGFPNTMLKLRALREAERLALTTASPQADPSPDTSVTPSAGAPDSSVRATPDSSVTQIGKETGKGCSIEHPPGARADEADRGFDVVFDAALGAYDERGQDRTHRPLARAAFRAVFAEQSPQAWVATVRRYVAEDADVKRGDYGAPAFETWLEGERWRRWTPKAEVAASRTAFAGPADLRAAIVADPKFGEGWAGSWLDRCVWDAERRALRPATGEALRRLPAASDHFRAFDVRVEAPASGGTS